MVLSSREVTTGNGAVRGGGLLLPTANVTRGGFAFWQA
jgi:hypothetical protein